MVKKGEHIAQAYWEKRLTGIVCLSSDWVSKTKMPPLGLAPDEASAGTITRLSPQSCGRYYRYYRQNKHWVFCISSSRYPELLDRKLRVYLAGDFNEWSEAIGTSCWELKPTSDAAETTYELRLPLERLPKEGLSKFKFVTEGGDWLDVPDSAPNRVAGRSGIANFQFNPALTGRHVFRFELPDSYEPVGKECIIWSDASGDEVHELPHTQYLTKAYSDKALGAIVEGATTTFRLFAPRADAVRVAVGLTPDPKDLVVHEMDRVDASIWECSLDQNLDGAYYSYRVEGTSTQGTTHFDGAFSILDPYAKACLGHRGPGIVLAPERLPKVSEPYHPPAWHDLVILEAHVRDIAAHAPIELTAQERKGYSGFRKWLKAERSYLKEIGVNAIELQPIQEFDNRLPEDYHWGYMTVNYFSPESSYALDSEKASQIEEFRGLVADCHSEGMAVILDVVYNHVGEPNHLLFIDKYYYFHLDDANDLVNWSGCGNDLRCDAPMTKRLIIDSLTHLVETYDVDGFRFDLAELIGIDVLREIEVELKKVKPSLILIAEPWSFRGHIQDELKETGFASWNDGFRECIADYVRGHGNQEIIRHFLSGSPSNTRFVAQTINYTESHDDHCWLDRITVRPKHNGWDPTVIDQRRTHLMAAVLFASLGVPMISAGQDFLRSKKGISNTYQRGDLNALDYNRRFYYSGTHGYFASWIHFRLSEQGKALRYDGGFRKEYMQFFFAEGYSAVLVLYNADFSVAAPQLLFGVNPHTDYASVPYDSLQIDDFLQISDHERFDIDGLKTAHFPVDTAQVHLPPRSCGLWRRE
ncbi:MAG: alpha-amylase family glycosyl hydrolase [Verrucomicrobiota bacterium]